MNKKGTKALKKYWGGGRGDLVNEHIENAAKKRNGELYSKKYLSEAITRGEILRVH